MRLKCEKNKLLKAYQDSGFAVRGFSDIEPGAGLHLLAFRQRANVKTQAKIEGSDLRQELRLYETVVFADEL